MNILELHLLTADLEAQAAFYLRLELPVELNDHELRVHVGSSLLIFSLEPGFAGRYHLAFDVPENQIAQATEWLEARTALIGLPDGTTHFHVESWNSDGVYFLDPAGNILELIARHTAVTTSDAPFSSQSLLFISEIGLASPDPPATVAWFREQLGLEPYRAHSDSFAPLGDETGLFIVVSTGREWFPQTGVSAVPLPTGITVAGSGLHDLETPGLPYRIRVRPEGSR